MSNQISPTPKVMVLAGAGTGLGTAVAARFAAGGYKVIGLSRSGKPLLSSSYVALACDLTNPQDVASTFDEIVQLYGIPSVVVHNVGDLLRAPFQEISSSDFERVWKSMVLSAMIVSKCALKYMASGHNHSLIFTGATASVRGSAGFAAFASAKFALRGLAQALAREYQPRGIHISHVILDGLIASEKSRLAGVNASSGSLLDPAHIGDEYWHLAHQEKSAWTHELDLRPYSEQF